MAKPIKLVKPGLSVAHEAQKRAARSRCFCMVPGFPFVLLPASPNPRDHALLQLGHLQPVVQALQHGVHLAVLQSEVLDPFPDLGAGPCRVGFLAQPSQRYHRPPSCAKARTLVE